MLDILITKHESISLLLNQIGIVVQGDTIEDCEKELLISLDVIIRYLKSKENDS